MADNFNISELDISKMVDQLYLKYDYLGIKKEEIKDIVTETINNTLVRKNYLTYLKRMINSKIIKYGSEMLLDNDTAMLLIDKYINKSFEEATNYNVAFNNLKKLNSFFGMYNYNPEPDVLIELIRDNQLFNDTLEEIYLKNAEYIKKGLIEKIFSNSLNTIMLSIYCVSNGIEYQVNEDFSNENYLETDNLKAYFNEIKNIKPKSYEETLYLMKRIKQGDMAAKEEFIKANLRLVVMFARRYYRYDKLNLLDLIQAGNIGLMQAVDKYDTSLGYRFSTYAEWWIKTAIAREIQNYDRTIRVPIHMHEKISIYNKQKEELLQKYGRELSLMEIANELGLTYQKAQLYERIQSELPSLNDYLSDEEGEEIINMVVDNNVNDEAEERIYADAAKIAVLKLLNEANLSPKELIILKSHFGIDCVAMTLEAIGEEYGISRERVRQLEMRALSKLRDLAKTEEFAEFMDNPDRAKKKLEEYRKVYKIDRNARTKSHPLRDYEEEE